MNRETSLAQLLEQARSGDQQALGKLLDGFRDSLCNLARQLLSPDLAQKVAPSDLVQETCIDAMRDFARAEVSRANDLEAWLVTLLTHNVIDWQRRFKRSKKRDVRREQPLQNPESKGGAVQVVAIEPPPEALLAAAESQQLLAQALEQLPRGYREIILWRHQEQLSWKDIAARLDRSEDAVRMLWNRALDRLKRIMGSDS